MTGTYYNKKEKIVAIVEQDYYYTPITEDEEDIQIMIQCKGYIEEDSIKNVVFYTTEELKKYLKEYSIYELDVRVYNSSQGDFSLYREITEEEILPHYVDDIDLKELLHEVTTAGNYLITKKEKAKKEIENFLACLTNEYCGEVYLVHMYHVYENGELEKVPYDAMGGFYATHNETEIQFNEPEWEKIELKDKVIKYI